MSFLVSPPLHLCGIYKEHPVMTILSMGHCPTPSFSLPHGSSLALLEKEVRPFPLPRIKGGWEGVEINPAKPYYLPPLSWEGVGSA